MKILIGADIVPTNLNCDHFINSNENELFDSELLNLLQDVDYRILNLEVPLTNKSSPIIKTGPNLMAPTDCVNLFKKIKIDFLNLANNHIYDQGYDGLISTIKTLNNAYIDYCGVGENLNKMKKFIVKTMNEEKIGIFSCAEHEFSIATLSSAGVNPFDPLETLDDISNLKKSVDYLIVLYHGGKEYYEYPSPYLQKVCRKIVEKGADLVVCQHTHCIGCEEKYKNSTIIYGQGDFLFNEKLEDKKNSLLIQVDTKINKITYHVISQNGIGITVSSPSLKKEILDKFNLKSNLIKNNSFILDQYSNICKEEKYRYLYNIQGNCYNSIIFRTINKLTNYKLLKFILDKKYRKPYDKAKLINTIECEVHKDCLLYELKREIK